jgi:hypothetical protein
MIASLLFYRALIKPSAVVRRPLTRPAALSTVAIAFALAIPAINPAVTRGQDLAPSQLLSAYGFNTVQQTYTGTGQTIAIYSESY